MGKICPRCVLKEIKGMEVPEGKEAKAGKDFSDQRHYQLRFFLINHIYSKRLLFHS